MSPPPGATYRDEGEATFNVLAELDLMRRIYRHGERSSQKVRWSALASEERQHRRNSIELFRRLRTLASAYHGEFLDRIDQGEQVTPWDYITAIQDIESYHRLPRCPRQ